MTLVQFPQARERSSQRYLEERSTYILVVK